MEKEMFRYAKEKKYLTINTSKRSVREGKLPLCKFVDTFSGTSMGGMVAAGYAVPLPHHHHEPALYSEDLMNFAKKVRPLFKEDHAAQEQNEFNQYLFIGASAGLFLAYALTNYTKSNKRIDELFKEMD